MRKTASLFLAVVFASIGIARAADNVLVLDGERFHKTVVKFTAVKDADYEAFLFLDKYGHGKTKSTRFDLHGTADGRPIEFQLSFQLYAPGTIEVVPLPDHPNDPAHFAMLIEPDKDTYGDGLQAKLGSMKVTVTKYEAVGGLIEGTVDGVLDTGGRADHDIHVTGHFSLRRQKDVTTF